MCVLSIKVHIGKSLGTYLMILVYIYIYIHTHIYIFLYPDMYPGFWLELVDDFIEIVPIVSDFP